MEQPPNAEASAERMDWLCLGVERREKDHRLQNHPEKNLDSNEILKLLENRRGDKEAQAFVKLRRQRAKQSKEFE
ncbi:UNVERIFIED_CONTAM: hypothetical protein K2H54_014418 [Gekko kuhli]